MDRPALAVALLTALAWSYLLWLSADMHMGGMNMTGLRMIPSGMGLMMPAGYAVAGDGVRIRLRHVDRDDGRYDDAIGGPDVSYVCPRGPADRAARQVAQGDRLVRGWLFPGLSRLRALRHIGAMGVRA